MVKLKPVTNQVSYSPVKQIGVVAALIQGFERIAARPILILPPLVIDSLLWLGPRLKIEQVFLDLRNLISMLPPSPGAGDQMMEQIEFLRQAIAIFGQRFNLLTAISSLPVGVPSLMKARLPFETPLGPPISIEVSDPLSIVALWLIFTIVGIGLGGFYHLTIAKQGAPEGEVGSALIIWWRLVLLSIGLYIGLGIMVMIMALMLALVGLLSPQLSMILTILGFSLISWIIVFLAFTPHGIVRYGLSVLRALVESVQMVRWNMASTISFVAVALLISWLTGQIWFLPEEASWFGLLAVIGHAFVVSMLVAGSYVFYQNRREWLVGFRRALAESISHREAPPPGR